MSRELVLNPPVAPATVASVTPSPAAKALAAKFATAFNKQASTDVSMRDAFAAANATHVTLVKGGADATAAWAEIIVQIGLGVTSDTFDSLLQMVSYKGNETDPAKRVYTFRQYAQHSAWAKREGLPIGPSAAKRASALESRVKDELPEGVTFGSWLGAQILPAKADDGTAIPAPTTLGALLVKHPSAKKAVKAVTPGTPAAPVTPGTLENTTGAAIPTPVVDIHAAANAFMLALDGFNRAAGHKDLDAAAVKGTLAAFNKIGEGMKKAHAALTNAAPVKAEK